MQAQLPPAGQGVRGRTGSQGFTPQPAPARFQNWLRDQNRTVTTPRVSVPRGTPVVRDVRRPNFGRLDRQFGRPNHNFAFVPRDRFSGGFFDRDRDGRFAFRHEHHHPIIFINFFYPFYFSDPFWFGFYYPGYYPSIYSLYGWCPPWVYPDRIFYDPYAAYYTPPAPYGYANYGYGLDSYGAQQAIDDIRGAWIQGDPSLIASHLTDQLDVQVYLNGSYQYTTSSNDYYGMTTDAIGTTQTLAMDFGNPIWISPDQVFYTGRHDFQDPDGNRHAMYVSYRLQRYGSGWYIASVGTSLTPIQSHYSDFRYS